MYVEKTQWIFFVSSAPSSQFLPRFQLHPVLSDCRAGRAEKPEARSEGRGGQEGRRHDQDEEVDWRQTRG